MGEVLAAVAALLVATVSVVPDPIQGLRPSLWEGSKIGVAPSVLLARNVEVGRVSDDKYPDLPIKNRLGKRRRNLQFNGLRRAVATPVKYIKIVAAEGLRVAVVGAWGQRGTPDEFDGRNRWVQRPAADVAVTGLQRDRDVPVLVGFSTYSTHIKTDERDLWKVAGGDGVSRPLLSLGRFSLSFSRLHGGVGTGNYRGGLAGYSGRLRLGLHDLLPDKVKLPVKRVGLGLSRISQSVRGFACGYSGVGGLHGGARGFQQSVYLFSAVFRERSCRLCLGLASESELISGGRLRLASRAQFIQGDSLGAARVLKLTSGDRLIMGGERQIVRVDTPAMHFAKLENDHDHVRDSAGSQDDGEDAQTPRPPSHYPFVLGVFLLCGAVGSLIATFKGADYADEHGSALGWGATCCALAFAFCATYFGIRVLAGI